MGFQPPRRRRSNNWSGEGLLSQTATAVNRPTQVTPNDSHLPSGSSRTELAALRKDQARRKEGITMAKSGRLPSAQAFAGYGAQSSTFNPDLSYELHGWLAGVQVSWDIFDGQLTKGRVKEATATEFRYTRSSETGNLVDAPAPSFTSKRYACGVVSAGF